MLAELKRNFCSGKTLDIDFRISQLNAIIKGLDDHYDLLCDAMFKDLGRGKFETTTDDIGLVKN